MLAFASLLLYTKNSSLSLCSQEHYTYTTFTGKQRYSFFT
nr:MAG TPA: hypothetical protein [Caudoviricetes sp.]